jgi:hypothetical protein
LQLPAAGARQWHPWSVPTDPGWEKARAKETTAVGAIAADMSSFVRICINYWADYWRTRTMEFFATREQQAREELERKKAQEPVEELRAKADEVKSLQKRTILRN